MLTLEEFILGPSSEDIATQNDFRKSSMLGEQNAGKFESNEATSWTSGKVTSTQNMEGFQGSNFLVMTVPVTDAVQETSLIDQRKPSQYSESIQLCKLIEKDDESKDIL
jgi:hypothetical protein